MENKKIKLLVDAHVFDNSYQGTTTYIKGLYNAFVEFEEFQITLCASDVQNLKIHFPSKKFKYVQLKSKSSIKRLLFEFPKIIEQGNYDYAHFQYIVPFIKKCKYINTIHDLLFMDFKKYFSWKYRFIRGNIFKFSALKSDIILTVSEYSKKDISNKFKINLNDIYITPNAVNLCDDNSISVKEKYNLKNYIHYVSRFEPRKNQIGLLKAYLSLKLYEKDIDLVFVGRHVDNIEKKLYQKLINMIPADVENRIHFFEDIDDDELRAFYKESLCFVYPSFAEGFGIPPLEAAIYECKVLCSNQTAMSDFSFFKYSFNPSNRDQFLYELEKILLEENYPFHEIKKTVLNKYNWGSIASELRDIMHKN